MAPNKKYLSLEEAATLLGIKPDELIRLRERGEVRGFADKSSWKFKADDVEEFRRRREPSSDTDLPIMGEDDDFGSEPMIITKGDESDSDSDVRLSAAKNAKASLTGSSAELAAVDSKDSDSDVRLSDSKTGKKKKGSDSDVTLVKPNLASKSDSDSDVKIVADEDSDSDVKLLKSGLTTDSDSDVRLATSDSDVRLAPLTDSDSDVKLIGKSVKAKKGSDSDVTILSKSPGAAKSSRKDTEESDSILLGGDSGIQLESDSGIQLEDSGLPLGGADSGIRVEPADSGFRMADESGIRLSGDSGRKKPDGSSSIRLGASSGIRIGGDSGIRLADDSGVELKKPADSGISLEGDSGINLAGDSGINLMSGSSATRKPKGDSSAKPRPKQKPVSEDELDSTSPMLLSSLHDEEDLETTSPLMETPQQTGSSSVEFDLMEGDDTTELLTGRESGHNVVMFEDDEDEGPVSTKKPKKQSVEESIFGMDEEVDELEVSEEDLSGEEDIDDLAFDEGDEDLDDSFSTGASRVGYAGQMAVAREVEWGTGTFFLLLASVAFLAFGSMMSIDLLRTVWGANDGSVINTGLAGQFGGLWGK
jgi:hypothetical protein